MMLPNVYALLRDSPDVVALVGERINRHGYAPQKTEGPYVTWFIVSGVPENSLSDLPPIDNFNVQIDVWSVNDGDGDEGVETVAQAVREAIESRYHVTSFFDGGRDEDTGRYRIGLTYTHWLDRDDTSSET